MTNSIILFVNPPNTDTLDTPELALEQAGAGELPALGILTLASAVKEIDGACPIYIDGAVCPFSTILDFISSHRREIAAICLSTLSATYGAGLRILEHARRENPGIVHILGNDHFTALPSLCMMKRPELIDCGIVGNEVVESLCRVVSNILGNNGHWEPAPVPGLVFRDGGKIVQIPQKPEPIFSTIDYSIMNVAFDHSKYYERAFRKTFPNFVKNWFGRDVNRSMSIELARGCVKFKNDDACSFCSIQYGGMWKNSVSTGIEAWNIVKHAFQAGYDHLFVTADELPLTFQPLLLDMRDNIPSWLLELPERERPMLAGYARADGLCVEKNARLLHDLGFRFVYVGVDAGPIASLQAFNKQFVGDLSIRLDQLYEANQLAFKQAARVGLKIDIGYVIGHIGMTQELLLRNIELFQSLVKENCEAIGSVDVNILTAEPGSKDYRYLLHPELAERKASELGMEIAGRTTRQAIADSWKEKDVMVFEEQITDYVRAFMPELDSSDLLEARKEMHGICHDNNVRSYT